MPLCGTRRPPLALRPGLQDLLGPGVGGEAAQRVQLGQLHRQSHVLLGRGDDVDGGVPHADVRRPGDAARTVLPVLPDKAGTFGFHVFHQTLNAFLEIVQTRW